MSTSYRAPNLKLAFGTASPVQLHDIVSDAPCDAKKVTMMLTVPYVSQHDDRDAQVQATVDW